MTPPPILLDPVADSNAGYTAVHARHTVYMSPPFVPRLLANELSAVEIWKKLRGLLVTADFEAYC